MTHKPLKPIPAATERKLKSFLYSLANGAAQIAPVEFRAPRVKAFARRAMLEALPSAMQKAPNLGAVFTGVLVPLFDLFLKEKRTPDHVIAERREALATSLIRGVMQIGNQRQGARIHKQIANNHTAIMDAALLASAFTKCSKTHENICSSMVGLSDKYAKLGIPYQIDYLNKLHALVVTAQNQTPVDRPLDNKRMGKLLNGVVDQFINAADRLEHKGDQQKIFEAVKDFVLATPKPISTHMECEEVCSILSQQPISYIGEALKIAQHTDNIRAVTTIMRPLIEERQELTVENPHKHLDAAEFLCENRAFTEIRIKFAAAALCAMATIPRSPDSDASQNEQYPLGFYNSFALLQPVFALNYGDPAPDHQTRSTCARVLSGRENPYEAFAALAEPRSPALARQIRAMRSVPVPQLP